MNKKTLWTIVVMAFALNLGGILWIRSELLDSGTVGFSREEENSKRPANGEDIFRCSPEMGEHTDEVLDEYGFDMDEVRELRAEGTVA